MSADLAAGFFLLLTRKLAVGATSEQAEEVQVNPSFFSNERLFFRLWSPASTSGPFIIFLSEASSTRRLLQYASHDDSKARRRKNEPALVYLQGRVSIVVLEIGLCPPFKGVVLVSGWIFDQDT